MQEWKTEKLKVIFKMELVRIFTAGNVDDGKSTLIGRLLLDSNALSTDVIRQVTEQGGGAPNLAFLTDGLRAERSMGITIDVAYAFFRTDRRQFILVDTPGHEEYTRNMFAGASVCDIAIVLMDAHRGMAKQTKKHIDILVSLGIKKVIFAINKMDLVEYQETVFMSHCEQIKAYLNAVSAEFSSWFVPVSALTGASVVFPGESMPWYQGETVFSLVNGLSIEAEGSSEGVIEIEGIRNQTGYAKVLSGVIRPQATLYRYEESVQLPSFFRLGLPASEAEEGTSIAFSLPENLCIQRGQRWSTEKIFPTQALRASLCWMAADEPGPTLTLWLSRGTAFHPVILHLPSGIKLNALSEVDLELQEPMDMALSIMENRKEHFILVDPRSNQTVGAGTLLNALG